MSASPLTDSETGRSSAWKATDYAAHVSPVMAGGGGNISVQTAANGTDFVAFASQECKQLTISNSTGTEIEVRQDGAGVALPVFDSTYYTFFGITNANQLSVRRSDASTTQVTVTARWEA